MIELATENRRALSVFTRHRPDSGWRAYPPSCFITDLPRRKRCTATLPALAQAGFRVVMPDAEMHGARYNGDTDARMTHFWEILRQNIDEVPLLEALRDNDWVADERLAIAGASMGGMTALGAMARYAHLHSVACLMGSGYFMQLSQTLFPPLVAHTPEQKRRYRRGWPRWRPTIPVSSWRSWLTVRCCYGTVKRMKSYRLPKRYGWKGVARGAARQPAHLSGGKADRAQNHAASAHRAGQF